MSNTITQEAYDEVVREFMQDFLMTAEEAIDDAVRHFETKVLTNCRICLFIHLSRWLISEKCNSASSHVRLYTLVVGIIYVVRTGHSRCRTLKRITF